jgi:hypothetical protein
VDNINGLDFRPEPDFTSPAMTVANYSAIASVLQYDPSGEWVQVWLDGLVGWLPTENLDVSFIQDEE